MDFGTDSTDPVDYPDVIAPAARAVASGDCQLGIVLGGSGTGEQIVANKIRGIRCVGGDRTRSPRGSAASTTTPTCSPWARGSSARSWRSAASPAFIAGEFQGGRHARRLEKVAKLEAEF